MRALAVLPLALVVLALGAVALTVWAVVVLARHRGDGSGS